MMMDLLTSLATALEGWKEWFSPDGPVPPPI